MYRLRSFLFILVALLCNVMAFAGSNTLFNEGWLFKKLDNPELSKTEFCAVGYPDQSWQRVQLPHTANMEPLVVNNQWQGICWYRKHFDINGFSAGKRYFLKFEAAMNKAQFWVNGKMVRDDQGGYLPIVIDVTPYVRQKGNVIAVCLDNRDNPVTGPKPLKILDFNMYGGLYRNAWMIEKSDVYISDASAVDKEAGGGIFITYPKVSEQESEVSVKLNLVNAGTRTRKVTVSQSIYDSDNKLVKKFASKVVVLRGKSDADCTGMVTMAHPKLWSPDSPDLYVLKTQVSDGKQIVDEQSTTFGIRKFEFVGQKLYINGKQTFLRGVNRHQEYPYIGYALSDNAQYRDAYKIKQAGFDYIRLSHYPQSPAFLDACDQLGLVVVDAILGWQYYSETAAFKNFCYDSARKLIRRDRNHPCVLAWEVSLNETKMPVSFMDTLNNIVHKEYPGPNVYSCGWMPEVYDIYLQARQHRIMHKSEMYTAKPYIVSEYGDWEYYSTNAGLNQHKMAKEKRLELSSRQFRKDGEARLLCQARNIQEAHNDNMTTNACADGYWVMYDYNRGYHDEIEASGIMDINRLPKFSYYFFRSQRDAVKADGNVLYIANYWDGACPDKVKVYSNAQQVELFLNGVSLGKQSPDRDSISMLLRHAPFTFNVARYEPGTLTAKAYVAGKCVKTATVTTPLQAVALAGEVDLSGRNAKAGCNDVLFVYIKAVDKNGTVCHGYTGTVDVKLAPNMTLMNTEGVKFEAGIATALVRIENNTGLSQISFSDDKGLRGKVNVNVVK